MTLAALDLAARQRSLTILGGFHPEPQDGLPPDCRTLILLGPDEPRFWPMFTRSQEYLDGAADPMNRWSRRVIDGWAASLGALAFYPFGGPPYQPFQAWALRTCRVHRSPILLLVHDTSGLFVSFRGAIGLGQRIDLPGGSANPCDTCADQPCRTACPVGAFDGRAYDVPACKAYLDTAPGADCMGQGCAVRRACPVSRRFGRLAEQSAFHMKAFHSP